MRNTMLRICRIPFVIPTIFVIFAPVEPAKPLNNAQIGGSFFYNPLFFLE